MPHLRSGEGGAIPSCSSDPNGCLVRFRMHIRELQLLRKEKELSYAWPYPFLAFVASTKGFIGDGHAVKRAGDDACAKMIYHLELQYRRGDPPYDSVCAKEDCESLVACGLFKIEKELEGDGAGEVSWKPSIECVVVADVLEGKVLKIGWYEEQKRIWHPVK